MIGTVNCIVSIGQEKKKSINGVVKLGENSYFRDQGITIGLISRSGERKG